MQKLIIRLQTGTATVEWMLLGQGETVIAGPAYAELTELSTKAIASEVIVVIPAEDVLLTAAQVPKVAKQQLVKAVPYALEENLLEALDELHFALGQAEDMADLAVAVVNKKLLNAWLARLEEAEIYPQAMVSEALMLPWEPTTWTIAGAQDKAIVRCSAQAGFAIASENLAKLLELKLSEARQKPKSLTVYPIGDANLKLADFKPCDMNYQSSQQSLLTLTQAACQQVPAINLLQGEYRSKKQSNQSAKLMKVSLALAAAWLVLLLGGNIAQYGYLRHQQNTLTTAIATVYRSYFPEAKQVVSPKLRIERALARVQANESNPEFMHLFAKVAKAMHMTKNIKLKMLNYQNQKLIMELQVENFENLNKLTKQLNQLGLNVKRDNAIRKSSIVNARLTISEAQA